MYKLKALGAYGRLPVPIDCLIYPFAQCSLVAPTAEMLFMFSVLCSILVMRTWRFWEGLMEHLKRLNEIILIIRISLLVWFLYIDIDLTNMRASSARDPGAWWLLSDKVNSL